MIAHSINLLTNFYNELVAARFARAVTIKLSRVLSQWISGLHDLQALRSSKGLSPLTGSQRQVETFNMS